jgi:hypothetical protein
LFQLFFVSVVSINGCILNRIPFPTIQAHHASNIRHSPGGAVSSPGQHPALARALMRSGRAPGGTASRSLSAAAAGRIPVAQNDFLAAQVGCIAFAKRE